MYRGRCMRVACARLACPRVHHLHHHYHHCFGMWPAVSLPPTVALRFTSSTYSTALSRSPHCLFSHHNNNNTTNSSSSTNSSIDTANEEEEEEMRQVRVFRPPMSAEEAERHRATSHFLAQLLTTADEQEWRDMLAAALRCGTWKEHHTLALLRGIHASRYDTMPAHAEDDTSITRSSSDEGAARGKASPAQRRSTASQRLRRVRDVVQFCLEEGIRAERSNNDTDSNNTDDGSASDSSSAIYRPLDSTVHSLLVHTLRAACHPVGTSSSMSHTAPSLPTVEPTTTSTTDTESAIALACYGDVWSLLAWMERYGYHPQSHRVLDELERLVDTADEDGALQQQQPQQEGRSMASRMYGNGSEAGRRPGTRRVAMAMSHIHRTEYLRRERDWLKAELEHRAQVEAEGHATTKSNSSPGGMTQSDKSQVRPASSPQPRPEPKTR